MAQDSMDQYMTVNDADSGSTVNIQNLTTKLTPARQSDRSASGKVLDIIAALGHNGMEMDGCDVTVRDNSDTTSQPQACMSDVFQSPHLTATIATPYSLSESGDDLRRPKQIAKVVDVTRNGKSVTSSGRRMSIEWYTTWWNGILR
jgi:hypothetical protein